MSHDRTRTGYNLVPSIDELNCSTSLSSQRAGWLVTTTADSPFQLSTTQSETVRACPSIGEARTYLVKRRRPIIDYVREQRQCRSRERKPRQLFLWLAWCPL